MAARVLGPAPATFVDPRTNAPHLGSFRGPLPPIAPARGALDEVLRRKRWVYLAIASETTFVTLAVVRTGYVATSFAFVWDRRDGMLADVSARAPATKARVADDAHVQGSLAMFSKSVRFVQSDTQLDVTAHLGDFALEVSIDHAAAPLLAAIATLGGDRVSATEKRVMAGARGSVRAGGRTISLDGARVALDYTNGWMPRHTRWRWAFALGKSVDDAPIALNLTEGFVGERECALFAGGDVSLLAEPRFSFEASRPLDPWRLFANGIDLTFSPGGKHEERMNLVAIRSRFLQCVGTFSGTVVAGGREVRLTDVLGVVEDQDVLW